MWLSNTRSDRGRRTVAGDDGSASLEFLTTGLVLLLPFPFLGNIPPGAAACVLGLGLVERDGAIVALGYLASALALGITGFFTWVAWEGIMSFIGWAGQFFS